MPPVPESLGPPVPFWFSLRPERHCLGPQRQPPDGPPWPPCPPAARHPHRCWSGGAPDAHLIQSRATATPATAPLAHGTKPTLPGHSPAPPGQAPTSPAPPSSSPRPSPLCCTHTGRPERPNPRPVPRRVVVSAFLSAWTIVSSHSQSLFGKCSLRQSQRLRPYEAYTPLPGTKAFQRTCQGHARLSRREFLVHSANTDQAPAVCQCCSGPWGELGTNKSIISMNDKGYAEK